MSQRAWIILSLCLLLTSAALAVFALDLMPLGVQGEWVWQCRWTGRQAEVASPILAFVVFAACVWLVAAKLRQARATRSAQALIAVTLVALAALLQIGIAHLGRIGMKDFALVTLAPWANGYFFRATQVQDLDEFLSRYHEQMRGHGAHVRTHPPGAVAFYWPFIRFFDSHRGAASWLLRALDGSAFDPMPAMRSFGDEVKTRIPRVIVAAAWAASMALMAAACLTVVPVFLLAQRLHGPVAGLWAAAFTAALPGLLVFTPATDQLFCPLAAVVALLVVCGVERGRWQAWLAAGLVWSAGLFMSLVMLPLLALIGLFAAMQWTCARTRWQDWVRQACAFALAVVAFFWVLHLATGFRPVAAYARLLSIAPQAVRDAYDARVAVMTYRKWIWWNLADVAIFGGASLCVLYVAAWVRGLRERPRGRAMQFHLAFAVMLLALNFSGVTLGEVGRIWLPFMPFIAVLAAAECNELWGKRAWPAALALGLQIATAIVLKLRMAWL